MALTLKFGKKIASFGDNKRLYLVNSKKMYHMTSNWKFNRPPDESKVDEIRKQIIKSKNVDGIIHIAQIFTKDKSFKYVCYDGNHRREALKDISNMKVLVCLLRHASNETIKNEFIRLNKATPVPELYIPNDIDELLIAKTKLAIEECIKFFRSRYPKHFSSSRRPKRPNINQDTLNDILYDYIKENSLFSITKKELIRKLITINVSYIREEKIDLSKIPPKILEKCKKTGCYIFLKKDFIKDI